MKQFMKGIYSCKPILPGNHLRAFIYGHVRVVLRYLKSLHYRYSVVLKLTTGQRVQTIYKLICKMLRGFLILFKQFVYQCRLLMAFTNSFDPDQV